MFTFDSFPLIIRIGKLLFTIIYIFYIFFKFLFIFLFLID